MGVRVFHRDEPDGRLPAIAKDARLIVWLGVGAYTANMNYARIEPGEQNIIHAHPESEDTMLVLSGDGTVDDVTNQTGLRFRAGQVIHVPRGIEHRVRADQGVPVEIVGGPSPTDMAMLRHAVAPDWDEE